MTSDTFDDVSNGLKPRELRLERLLGRQVVGRNNRPAGRLEEFRAELRGNGCVMTEVVIGSAGLLERLGIGVNLLFGRAPGGRVARWDQIDLTDPNQPRLTCSFEELRKL
jgi:hypothetical protein